MFVWGKLRSLAFDLGCATRDLSMPCSLFPPPPVTICGQVRSGLWCLRVSVLVSQIAVAQRLGGILFPVKGWGEIWNSRALCGIRAVFFVFAHEMIRN